MTGRDASGATSRVDSVATLIVPTADAARDPGVAAIIRRAEAIWIAGGDQALHLAAWRDTPVIDALHDAVARGVPLGGTSSGLAVLGALVYSAEADGPSHTHLTSSQVLLDPYHPRLTLRRGILHLPLLAGTMLEPHFVQESRFGRSVAALARASADGVVPGALRVLGIEKKTALLVEPDGLARVIGGPSAPSAGAFLIRLNPDGPAAVCRPGSPLTALDVSVNVFRPGDVVDLRPEARPEGISYRMDILEGRLALARRAGVAAPTAVASATPAPSPMFMPQRVGSGVPRVGPSPR